MEWPKKYEGNFLLLLKKISGNKKKKKWVQIGANGGIHKIGFEEKRL